MGERGGRNVPFILSKIVGQYILGDSVYFSLIITGPNFQIVRAAMFYRYNQGHFITRIIFEYYIWHCYTN